MTNDNSPKKLRRKKLERKQGQRKSYDRILIVSEGSKTEPKYFNEIRCTYKLATTAVHICPSSGTDPLSVINYAEKLFKQGNPHKGIQPFAFDQVYAVFDRDEHSTYFEAIEKAESLDKDYNNTKRRRRYAKFAAIPSIPNFEIWLLLHFKNVLAPLDSKNAFDQVKKHIPKYEKSTDNIFESTREYFDLAYKRAEALAKSNTATGTDPYTEVHHLVKLLKELKVPQE